MGPDIRDMASIVLLCQSLAKSEPWGQKCPTSGAWRGADGIPNVDVDAVSGLPALWYVFMPLRRSEADL